MKQQSELKPESTKGFIWLALAGLATAVLSQLPFGSTILYPFSLLGTWFHEMGHGLTCLVLGGSFKSLEIFANGSGVAHNSYATLFLGNRVGQALISSGGLLGPSFVGAWLIISGRTQKMSKITLIILSFAMIASAFIWIRTGIGFVMILSIGIVSALISIKAPQGFVRFFVQFIGVQACISAFQTWDYLFMGKAVINGQEFTSDTGKIAEKLWLPYWFWGILIAIIAILVFLKSLDIAFRK